MRANKSFAKITAEELYEKISQKTDLIIIDTLPKELFEQRHLPGAQNACVFQVTFLLEVEAIVPDRNREVVLYGSSWASQDSVTAAEKLVRLGYSKVFALTGGLAAWREAGYPLEGNDPYSVDHAITSYWTTAATPSIPNRALSSGLGVAQTRHTTEHYVY